MTKKELVDTIAGMIDDGRCSEPGSTERHVEQLLNKVEDEKLLGASMLVRRVTRIDLPWPEHLMKAAGKR